jgi:hypothetical protein
MGDRDSVDSIQLNLIGEKRNLKFNWGGEGLRAVFWAHEVFGLIS